MMYEVIARMRIREGQLEGFKRQAAEMMRLTIEKDTKTLRYDWFLSSDEAHCEVHEAYVDADGLLEHHYHVAEPKMILFRDHAGGHDMALFGEPSEALAAAIKEMSGHVVFHLYSLLDGMAASADAAVG